MSVNRSLLLKESLDKCNMIDIGFSGPCFTWTNKARVTHLTRSHFDHCPILMELLLRVNGVKKRSFRFQTCWLLDATFPNIVSQA